MAELPFQHGCQEAQAELSQQRARAGLGLGFCMPVVQFSVSVTVTGAAPALTADEAHEPRSSKAHNTDVTCLRLYRTERTDPVVHPRS